MQVFRLVQGGKVDKVIAFDELPKRLLKGVEMHLASGLPRHWRDFIGKVKKHTPAVPDKNPVTGKVEMVGERTDEGPYCYVLEYKEINKDKERWEEICNFVRRTVSLQFRLMDKIEDMALSFAPDAASELKLEPEELEQNGAIIPIPEEFQEKGPALVDGSGKEIRPEPVVDAFPFKCEKCEKGFKNEQAIRMHSMRAHKEEKKEVEKVLA